MRALVFAQPQAKQQLEAILHPLIALETQRQARPPPGAARGLRRAAAGGDRARWRRQVDRVLVVDCSEATQRRGSRPAPAGPGPGRAGDPAAGQPPARRAAADAVIVNDGLDLAELAAEVDALWTLGFFGVPAIARL
jgi:dephospho-CoA kinase